MATELSNEERAEERRLITNGAWPHFPLLPVKRPNEQGGLPDVGIIAYRNGLDTGPVKVYMTNLFALAEKADKHRQETGMPATYRDVLKDAATEEFATLEDFFNAGWRGD